MRFNFKKIAAIGTSILLTGMSMGFAAAAYPAPFVSNGVANVGVIYGTGAGVDAVFDVAGAATPIMTNLQSYMGASTGGATATTSGETASFDTSADRIWLNTSLDAIRGSFTKSDLPTVLADYTFSGNVDSKIVSTLKLITSRPATTQTDTGMDRVVFAKQPGSSDDPVIGVSLNTSRTGPLYNASATMSAVNFTNANSKGQEIQLFGQKFTVSADTDTTNLVLLKQAQTVDLSIGGTSPVASKSVTIGNNTYTVELVATTDTSATIKVTDSKGASDSKTISEATSKKIQGLQVAVKTATASSKESVPDTASLIVGAEKLTFTAGQAVTTGDNSEPIDGTYVYLTGGTTATTEIAIAVFAPDSTKDAIVAGGSFVDPVFGSFKVDFAGLSSPLDDANRDIINVAHSGNYDTMELTMTDSKGNTKTFPFAFNATYAANQVHTAQVIEPANWRLSDNSNNSIKVIEGANLSVNEYTILGNQDYGHLVQVTQITNSTAASLAGDKLGLKDVITGEIYNDNVVFDSYDGASTYGHVQIDGKRYNFVTNSTSDGWVNFKYPTSESATANTYVVYPTIKTKNGALVALYEPLNITLGNINGTAAGTTILNFPDGDGYTGVTFTYVGLDSGSNWTVSGGSPTVGLVSNLTAGNYTSVTIGKFQYNFSMQTGTANRTVIYLINPEATTTQLTAPGVIVFEGKDKNNNYEGLTATLETAPAGTSTDGVGVSDVLFTTAYYHGAATRYSNSKLTDNVDYFGTLATLDSTASSQTDLKITYPKSQVYAQLYMGSAGSSVTGGTTTSGSAQLGNVLYKDSEVSSASTKNLIIVGGSCINSAAAALVGGAKCDADWTTATGVGSGQFLIQSFGSDKQSLTSGIALLVAGYGGADTVNAATYLTTSKPDVSAGKKWIGTSTTSATLQTASA